MSVTSSNISKCPPIIIEHLQKSTKTYILDPQNFFEQAKYLGKNPSNFFYQAKMTVESDKQRAEKEYSIKTFSTPQKSTEEYFCHLEIIKRTKYFHEDLTQLGVIPGSGIEKTPIGTATLDPKNYALIKHLYDKNLRESIQEGYFDDPESLLQGSKQLLEGMVTFISTGTLYCNIELDSILVRKRKKLELAFTNFEQLSFLQFNATDEDRIKNELKLRLPYSPLYQKELLELLNLKKTRPPQEFLENLHKLYVFALGVIFFEMTTKMRLTSSLKIEELRKKMFDSKTPQTYIELVLSMLEPQRDKRIDISKALGFMQNVC